MYILDKTKLNSFNIVLKFSRDFQYWLEQVKFFYDCKINLIALIDDNETCKIDEEKNTAPITSTSNPNKHIQQQLCQRRRQPQHEIWNE